VARISTDRQDFAIGIVGGPTTVLDLRGRRLVMDPTFDPPGDHGYLTKTAGPAVSAAEVGAADIVLVSHDLHPDNLDAAGRAYAVAAPVLLTGVVTAARLSGPAVGLAPWEDFTSPAAPGRGRLTIRAVPAVHGPADGARDEQGNVNCEVTGFVVSGDGVPTVYLSGDNASLDAVARIAQRVGPVDVAVLFVGAARVPTKERGRALTLTSARAAAAAEILGAPVVVPAHYDGWAHFTEGADRITAAFDDTGLADVLRLPRHGEWADLRPGGAVTTPGGAS
jgi:L-ascorbate metabolism protein UlaG (beta-lactamase superfamily)